MSRTPLLASLVAFALLASGFGAVAQDDPPPAAPAPSPPPATASSPEALAILAAAIAYQGPEEFAREGAIRDLTVRIAAEVWDYSKEPAEKTSLGVNRYLTLDPEAFRSEWKTSVETRVYGKSGRLFWYAEYDNNGALVAADGNPRFLAGDKYADDRKRVEDEIAETRYLLRFFFLANLRGPKVIFTREKDESLDWFGAKRDCYVLRRDNLDPQSTEPPLTLWIDGETKALLQAKAHAGDYGQKSLIFSFRYDENEQPRVKGVLFPVRIETREQPFGAPNSRLANRATVRENGIAFNTGLDPAMFLCPRLPGEEK